MCPFGVRLGTVLGQFGLVFGQFGVVLGQFGLVLGPFGFVLDQSVADLGSFWINPWPIWVRLDKFLLFFVRFGCPRVGT